MLALAQRSDRGATIRRDVANHLHDAFSSEDSALGWMDRWTELHVIDQNMAKISLVLDAEAETGIYLLGKDPISTELRELAKDPDVSEIVMSHLTAGDRSNSDMGMALRSLLYSFHEDLARRTTGLEPMLDERNTRELLTMISVLIERAGDYGPRIKAICECGGKLTSIY